MRVLKTFILLFVGLLCALPALAEYAIIADWDAQLRVSRYNYVKTEIEAQAIIEQLHSILLLEDQAPNAYYVEMPLVPVGYRSFAHRARFWIANPVNGTVSIDTTAIHRWQSNITNRAVDREADKRVDKVFSPNDLLRAGRIRSELSEGAKKSVLMNRVVALRVAAQTLKESFVILTAEEILAIQVHDNIHWPE